MRATRAPRLRRRGPLRRQRHRRRPPTLSNIGVFQLAVISVLRAGFGIGIADALAYGVILQALEIATAVALGLPALSHLEITGTYSNAVDCMTFVNDEGLKIEGTGGTAAVQLSGELCLRDPLGEGFTANSGF